MKVFRFGSIRARVVAKRAAVAVIVDVDSASFEGWSFCGACFMCWLGEVSLLICWIEIGISIFGKKKNLLWLRPIERFFFVFIKCFCRSLLFFS